MYSQAPTVTPGQSAELHALLLAWNVGDAGAGQALWSRLQKRLAPCARRLARRGRSFGLEADDLLQEAAARLILHRDRFAAAGGWNLVAYLERAMLNTVIDRARRNAEFAYLDESVRETCPCLRTVDPPAAAVVADLRQRVDQSLATLGPRLARAVWSAHALDLPWKRIASDGGWAGEDSARVAVTRTLGALRVRLGSFRSLGA